LQAHRLTTDNETVASVVSFMGGTIPASARLAQVGKNDPADFAAYRVDMTQYAETIAISEVDRPLLPPRAWQTEFTEQFRAASHN